MINNIRNLFNDGFGALQGKPKVKLHVEFNESPNTQREVEAILHGYKVVSAEKKGVHTWRVNVRSNKDSADIVTALEKRAAIRLVEVVGD